MTRSIYWFRNDLRLLDNPAFTAACNRSSSLLPAYVVSPDETALTSWGFERWGSHRQRFRDQALAGLKLALLQHGSDLLVIEGEAVDVLTDIARTIRAERVVCQSIAGRSADPRKGRRFDPVQQADHSDPTGFYRRLWGKGRGGASTTEQVAG